MSRVQVATGSKERLSANTLRHTALYIMCVVAGALAPAFSPNLASAQYNCGMCSGFPGVIHQFDHGPGTFPINRYCDNSGGCHVGIPYYPGCEAHTICAAQDDTFIAALNSRQPSRIRAELALANNWTYDPDQRTLSVFACGALLAARLPVPLGIELPRSPVNVAPRVVASQNHFTRIRLVGQMYSRATLSGL